MPTQPTVEDYIKLLKNPDATVRAQAVEKLGELDSKQAVEPLIKLIDTYGEDVKLKHAAMVAISKIDVKASIQYFIKRLIDSYRDTYWEFPSDLYLSGIASEILISFGEIVVEPLIEALKSTDTYSRGGVAYTLGKLKDKRASNPLITLLVSDKEVSIRCQAAWSLGEIGEAEALIALEKSSQTDFEKNYTYDSGTTTVSEVAASAIKKIKTKGNSEM